MLQQVKQNKVNWERAGGKKFKLQRSRVDLKGKYESQRLNRSPGT